MSLEYANPSKPKIEQELVPRDKPSTTEQFNKNFLIENSSLLPTPEQKEAETTLMEPSRDDASQNPWISKDLNENPTTESIFEAELTNENEADNDPMQSNHQGTPPPLCNDEDVGQSSDEEQVEDFFYEELQERIKKAPKRLTQASQYVQLLEDRVSSLEKRLQELDSRGEATLKKKGEETGPKPKPTVPEIRRVKWTEFKNKYEGDSQYALEVLVGGARYWYQRRKDEQARRWNLGNEDFLEDSTAPTASNSEIESQVPERVRINSKPLLTILSDIIAEDWSVEPRVFLRPYKLFTRYDKEIREFYKKLEGKWAGNDEVAKNASSGQENTRSLEAKSPSNNQIARAINAADHISEDAARPPISLQEPNEERDKGTGNSNSEDLVGSLEAFKDLRCLIEFMDTELVPAMQRYQDPANRKVRFQDLHFLFKPGQEVYAPRKRILEGDRYSKPLNSANLQGYQTAYKVLQFCGARPFLSQRDTTEPHVGLKDRMSHFTLFCYYIDFNGSQFIPCYRDFIITPFEGEREITSLEVYPWQYAERRDVLREKLRERGENFMEFIKSKHMHYVGSTLVSFPSGGVINEEPPLHSETIDSEVIVDFTQGIEAHPYWVINSKQAYGLLGDTDVTFLEDYPTRLWKDRDERDLILNNRTSEGYALNDHQSKFREYIQNDNPSELRLSDQLIANDPFLSVDEPSGKVDPTNKYFRDEDLILLPSRVIGYVLRDRRWALLNISYLRPVKPNSEGFSSLKLPGGHKAMVKALVQSHSMKAEVGISSDDTLDYDVVHGKGKGLIILLHGVPGVGKTSTAECVAGSTGKPLFPITCGDLGTKPDQVERSLHEKFHLAQVWDCVLLLDEADVFLAERSKSDLNRNALVSVFLRVLEYYTGILFLTTNRVGAFDEAFKSRIHISLYYPPLAKKQTQKIWEMNLERTKKLDFERSKTSIIPAMEIKEDEIMQYAIQHFEEHEQGYGRWNGRQIRNAFQTATAIALYNAHETTEICRMKDPKAEPMKPVLDRTHFQKVAKATRQFENYMTEARGRTDAERAFVRQDRADGFDFHGVQPQQNPHMHHYMPRPPYQQMNNQSMYSQQVSNQNQWSTVTPSKPGSRGSPLAARQVEGPLERYSESYTAGIQDPRWSQHLGEPDDEDFD